jgi:hypothetical protein
MACADIQKRINSTTTTITIKIKNKKNKNRKHGLHRYSEKNQLNNNNNRKQAKDFHNARVCVAWLYY